VRSPDRSDYFGIFAALVDGAAQAGIELCTPYDEPFVELYDVEQQGPAGDLDFFASMVQRHGGPVLELACGSGRIAVPLSRQGFSVHGVDRSSAMLERARNRMAASGETAGSLQLEQADVFEYVRSRANDPQDYGIIIVGATMFAAFAAEGGPTWLRTLGELLRPDGALCFDVARPGTADGGVNGRQVHTRDGRVDLVSGSLALAEGQGHIFNAYAERADRTTVRRYLATETVLTPSDAQLQALLRNAALSITHREALGDGAVQATGYVARRSN
jgi:SAM-dependent methyltransferase